jgi:acetate kinase
MLTQGKSQVVCPTTPNPERVSKTEQPPKTSGRMIFLSSHFVMHILVLNSGSSSIKFSIFKTDGAVGTSDPHCLFDGELSGVGLATASLSLGSSARGTATSRDLSVPGLSEALKIVFEWAGEPNMPAINAVGYRVVHPGAKLRDHQRVTTAVLQDIKEASSLAPLHDPETVIVIEQAMKRWPQAQHFACFDTVFHQTMPEAASMYAIPAVYREQGVHRYGFHGLSCESIVRSMSAGGTTLPKKMIIAHLGSGCSVTALVEGRSVDTTMGLTPTGGLVMGTRAGDLDPGVLFFLLRQQKPVEGAVNSVEALLNDNSGLVALTELPNDMQVIRKAAKSGNASALLGLEVFTRSITKAIGAFCWLIGGLDAIVFSGGIGEHDPRTREAVLRNLEDIGVTLDPTCNESQEEGVHPIHSAESRVLVFVVPSQEDLMIAIHVSRMAALGQ